MTSRFFPAVNRWVVPASAIEATVQAEQRELERRERAYRGDRPAPTLREQVVILVDDGLATGSTMQAAAAAVRSQEPARLVIAVPVAAADVCAHFRTQVDEVVCAATPAPFVAVGLWYDNFAPTTDEEVRTLLGRARPTQLRDDAA